LTQKTLKNKLKVKRKVLIIGSIIFFLLLIDQLTKIYIKSSFSSNETNFILGDWFALHYIENPGMAFGTTFGSEIWHKLALSLLRVVAIIFIGIFIYKEIKKDAKIEYLIAISLIFSGATGNLIDSMLYDFIFPFNPCEGFNQLAGSGIKMNCMDYGFKQTLEVRHQGFLLGNVVDMFQFNFYWPKWVPYFSGQAIFPAIWNIADACITSGVILIIIRQKKYFPKKVLQDKEEEKTI
jgi:signal peptidase II